MINRREFIGRGAVTLCLAALEARPALAQQAAPVAPKKAALLNTIAPSGDGDVLYNKNFQTAIGIGDEPAGIVDSFGRLDSRKARLRISLGSAEVPIQPESTTQTLESDFLPIVNTEVRTTAGSLRWKTFSSDASNLPGDLVQIEHADLAHTLTLEFPFVTEVALRDRAIEGGGDVLAIVPPDAKATIRQAKYNLLTPVRYTSTLRKPPGTPAGFDPAFSASRVSFLFHPLKYRFPVEAGKQYFVVLGVAVPPPSMGLYANTHPRRGETLLRLSVNEQSEQVDIADLTIDKPWLHSFVVQPSKGEILVISETDPSATLPFRPALLNGIWIFDAPVELEHVTSGEASPHALFYVCCGQERAEDMACAATFSLAASENSSEPLSVFLPYRMKAGEDAQIRPAPFSTQVAQVRDRWTRLLAAGAEFTTGDTKLDNLYKTSLLNIFLLRTRYASSAGGSQDIYAVKPGATIYDAFWYRDGSYLVGALNSAGHSDEAEKSLRLFWRDDLEGDLAALEQHSSGAWQSPLDETDSQGQALWALVRHFDFTGDKDWLGRVYPSIVKGARWISSATTQTQIRMEGGQRPAYFGLLPMGEGESIAEGEGYYFYLDYWNVFGLRMALRAARVLGHVNDATWIEQAYHDMSANLLVSVREAYQSLTQGEYIPASPFQGLPECDIFGSIAALYPTRFLDPHDPMMTNTLALIERNCKEAEYTYSGFFKKTIWTYMTVDWAMCCLLRHDLAAFHRLFDGYVAHAYPTNGWAETISLETRLGAGDMPHGWAAAQYVHLHRNALLVEDNDDLHLCWGAKAEWLDHGITVKRAPTEFGQVDLKARKNGTELIVEFALDRSTYQRPCSKVLFHFPDTGSPPSAVRVNGHLERPASGQNFVTIHS